MSYSSKKTISGMAVGIILITGYIIYALGGAAPAPEDLKAWAAAILIFIGIGIAAGIVIQILFHIAFAVGTAVKERERDDKTVERIISASVVEDERDKLIELRSGRIGHIFSGLGFVAALVALAFGMSALFALHILFGVFFVGALIEGAVSVYYYERGIRNG